MSPARLVGLSLLACASLAAPAAGQGMPGVTTPQREVEVSLEVGLCADGVASAGWVPCSVEVALRGLAREVEVELQAATLRFRRRVRLSPGQRRRLWFMVPLRHGDHELDATVSALGEGGAVGRTLHRARVGVEVTQPSNWTARVLYVRDPDPGDRYDPPSSWVPRTGMVRAGAWEPRRPSTLPPDPMAYDGVDLLILHGVDTTQLDRPQADAIRAWVALGGRVLLIPGADGRAWFEQPLLADLLEGRRFRDRPQPTFPGLVAAYGPPLPGLPPADVFVPDGWVSSDPLNLVGPQRGRNWRASTDWTRGDGLPAELDAAGRAFPLVHRLRRRDGQVFVLACDLGGEAFRGWAGRRQLCLDLLTWTGAAHGVRVRGRYGDEQDPLAVGSASHLDSRRRPGAKFMAGSILVYILCVGPLCYLLLSRRGQRERLIVVVPTVSLVFTLAIFAYGYATGGLTSVTWSVDLIRGELGERWAWQRSAASVLSALDPDHTVRLDAGLTGGRVFGGLGGEPPPQVYRIDDQGLAFDLHLERWQLAFVEGQRVCDLGAGVTLTTDPAGPPTLHNRSALRLERGLYFDGQPGPWITPPLAPGASAELAERLPPRRGPEDAPLPWRTEWIAAALVPGEPVQSTALAAALLRQGGVRAPQDGESRHVFVCFVEPPDRVEIGGRPFDERVSLLVLGGRP